jgi:hypothetical protein
MLFTEPGIQQRQTFVPNPFSSAAKTLAADVATANTPQLRRAIRAPTPPDLRR